MVTPQAFLDFVGDHLPQASLLDMPILTGEELHEAVMVRKATSSGIGWLGMERNSDRFFVFVCWTSPVLRKIEFRVFGLRASLICKSYGPESRR